MKNKQKKEIIALRSQWRKAIASTGREYSAVTTLLDALLHGRFRFESEAWLGREHAGARELLLRAWDRRGIIIPNAVLSEIAARGLLPLLDRFLIFSALHQVKPDPRAAITINVSCATLANPAFWSDLEAPGHDHRPDMIIFEILEYEKSYEIDAALLNTARARGYRLALDDFYPDAHNWKRLQDYAPYLDYIKLDGRFVREGLAGKCGFAETVARLRQAYPGLSLIAEFVETAAEAKLLFAMGISVVQGRALPDPYGPPRLACF